MEEAGAGEEQPHAAPWCLPQFPACFWSGSAWGWDNLGPFSLFFSMANKTRLLLAEARASVHQKQSRCLGRGGGRAAVLPFFSPPQSPRPRLLSVHNAKNWLQQVLFVAVPSVGSPHTRCPAWLPPHRAFSHSYPPGASFLLFATALGKMSHGHFACPQRGDSATLAAATPAPLLRCLAYQQAPSCEELGFASLQPLAAAAASRWGLAPRTQGWKELGSRCCSQLPRPVPAGGLLPAWSWNIEARVSCTCFWALLLPWQLISADNGGLGLLLQQRRRSPCPASLRVAFPCRIWGRGMVKQNLQLPRGWGSFFHSHTSIYCSPSGCLGPILDFSCSTREVLRAQLCSRARLLARTSNAELQKQG